MNAQQRWAICLQCPMGMFYQDWLGRFRCAACGCFIKLKVWVPAAHCPYGYW